MLKAKNKYNQPRLEIAHDYLMLYLTSSFKGDESVGEIQREVQFIADTPLKITRINYSAFK